MNDFLVFLAAVIAMVLAVAGFFYWLVSKARSEPDDWSNYNDYQ